MGYRSTHKEAGPGILWQNRPGQAPKWKWDWASGDASREFLSAAVGLEGYMQMKHNHRSARRELYLRKSKITPNPVLWFKRPIRTVPGRLS